MIRSLDSTVTDIIYILAEMKLKKGIIKMSDLKPSSNKERQKYYRILCSMQKFDFVRLEGKKWVVTEKLRWRIF